MRTAMTDEQNAAWRDGYLAGRRDGESGRVREPRGDTEAYELGYRWGQRHPLGAFQLSS